MLARCGQYAQIRCLCKKDVLKNFSKFTKKTPVLDSVFYKVAGLCLQLY